ncbi:MAG: LysR family transcriptional regulator [Thiofilum sp.]|uniref:LysR family transcriptional regulator n=1 Tax=Thiofilum sp. TaxID=2212733 RepID=UPI0025D311B5|nr:LysR family transcriptional regulator [Thiofilum sp.]MBK8454165.1 LysR family transcriptional regulator [Thiofilum sp.]
MSTKRRDALAGLSTFAAVAHYGSFTKAAAWLDISTVSVSLAVSELEKQLKTQLLIRNTRSVRLTEAGEAFFLQIQPALQTIQDAQQQLQQHSAKPQGLLRLTVPIICHDTIVQPLLQYLQQHAPELRVEVHYSDEFVDIIEQGFDAGIRLRSQIEQDKVAIPLTKPLHSTWVASPEYLKHYGIPDAPIDSEALKALNSHRCILFKYGEHQQLDHWDIHVDNQIQTVKVMPSVVLNQLQHVLSAAKAGLGIVQVMSTSWIRRELERGELVSLWTKYAPSYPEIMLYIPKQRFSSVKIKVLVNAARSLLS